MYVPSLNFKACHFIMEEEAMTIAEMPTSGDLKSGHFFHYPTPTPTPQKIDPAPNGNDLGHYMKSYMKYIAIKMR